MKQRALQLLDVELLELRMMLSASGCPDDGTSLPTLTAADISVAAVTPGAQAAAAAADGGSGASNLTPPFSPSQVASAYGFNNIYFPDGQGGFIKGDGAGQTIAIVVAYQQPNLAADLHTFSQQFGLPDAQLTICNQTGSTNSNNLPALAPKNSGNWGLEASLDVQWAHALAPAAKILVVEANSNSNSDLYAAVDTARKSGTGGGLIGALPKATVVSMSWGTTDYSGDSTFNTYFTTPSAKVGNTGVTFVAATGDTGEGAQYPATSAAVLAVGGTTLTINSNGNYGSETAWVGSSGNISPYNTQGAWQQGITPYGTTNPSGLRMAPDVAFDGSGSSGLYVYDSYDYPPNPNPVWLSASGTSVGTPCWAALVAIADQGKLLTPGAITLTGTQTLTGLYANYSNGNYGYAFHDVTSGTNHVYSAGSGFDLVTGLGTPRANVIAARLAGFSETPTTSGPAGSITTLTPTFQWSAIGGATGYLLTVVDATTNTTIINGVQVATNSYTPLSLLPNGDSFQWQVQAYDNNGTLGPASNLVSFTTAAVVNHSPSGTSATVTTLADTPYTFDTSDFGFSDPGDNPANNFLAVKITTLPAAGILTNDGVPVAGGQLVTASDIAAGLLVFTPGAGATGSPYTSFTFQVEDDGGNANGGSDLDPAAKTMTIAVLPLPRVAGVLVDGTTWSPQFLGALADADLGQGGYAIPVGSTAQLRALPWTNIDQIRVVFNEDVNVQEESLSLTGVAGGTYAFADFSYDPGNFTATWTLTTPMAADRISIDLHATGPGAIVDNHGTPLDGHWIDASSTYPSGTGTPGDDFDFAFNVLPADSNQDGVVNGLDIAQVATNWLQVGGIVADINGDNVINGLDVSGIASHWLDVLPAAGGSSSGTGVGEIAATQPVANSPTTVASTALSTAAVPLAQSMSLASQAATVTSTAVMLSEKSSSDAGRPATETLLRIDPLTVGLTQQSVVAVSGRDISETTLLSCSTLRCEQPSAHERSVQESADCRFARRDVLHSAAAEDATDHVLASDDAALLVIEDGLVAQLAAAVNHQSRG